jgi:hypothetical protein
MRVYEGVESGRRVNASGILHGARYGCIEDVEIRDGREVIIIDEERFEGVEDE